jgi:hypothetical protein
MYVFTLDAYVNHKHKVLGHAFRAPDLNLCKKLSRTVEFGIDRIRTLEEDRFSYVEFGVSKSF